MNRSIARLLLPYDLVHVRMYKGIHVFPLLSAEIDLIKRWEGGAAGREQACVSGIRLYGID